jgi:hypothetical protein
VILPTKHLPPGKSLLGVGAKLLATMDRPQTETALWGRVRCLPEVGTFERFVLALDLLYAIGAVDVTDGMLHRRRR